MIALEYGAGTGILSFLLKDYFKQIIMMDSSAEMVRVMQNKIVQSHIKNLIPTFFNLETNEFQKLTFDVIFSQMVLHHVKNIKIILTKLFNLMNINDYIAIIDLYKEDGSFHSDKFEGHKGFDVPWLENIFSVVGFCNIKTQPIYTITRLK